MHLDHPWVLPRGNQIMHLGSQLHESHHLVFHRGVVYCSLCGYIASSKVGKLKLSCDLKPANATQEGRLNRMKQGVWPCKGDWPVGPEAQCPHGISPYVDQLELSLGDH